MSIRLRLSLLYSGILALMMVLFGAIVYTTQAQYTMSWLKNDLLVSSDTLTQSILQIYLGSNPASPNPQQPQVPLASRQPPAQAFTHNPSFQQQSETEIVRVLDPGGALIASPIGTIGDSLPLSQVGLQAVRNKQDWWETDTVASKRLLIYSHPILLKDQIVSILQVARPLTERDQSLQALASTLLIAILLTALAAFGIGWILTGLALKPIHKITQTAQSIGHERDFTRRVVYSGPQDEVGQLAVTFNLMLSQLQDAYQKIEQALVLQRNFVADVSHELRTPLTTLRGNLGLLGRTPAIPADEQADILNDMVAESDRLIRLVNDLLVLARAEAGRNLARERISIRPVVEEICRQVYEPDGHRQILLQVQPEISVVGDRDAVKQVLLILVDNALKHSQGAITISAEPVNSRVMICVQDEGEGVAPEKLAHVFDRFYRGEDHSLMPGFGLGLPIAKALVEGLGGSIEIKSEVGKGSSLVLYFPKAS
ncbi:MAG: HAMP domain-containing sensor histidine kinase [Anaerolineaceae bacterium]|nr:HAMP domain-containing sensor histidine kinase [Anaerolineaceae bacterium]